MVETSGASSLAPHPMVLDLLAAGEGKTLAITGYIGPASEGRVRLYADLGLRTSIELARSDVVRVIDSTDTPQGPSTILFKRDAEVAYVQAMTLRADQALATAMSAPLAAQCGCGGDDVPTSIARQSGGGPVVDLCGWGCTERLQLCIARSGTFGTLWCYFNYASCRLGCLDPVIST
jgi:hypothetical protein